MVKPLTSLYKAQKNRMRLLLGFMAICNGQLLTPTASAHEILILKEAMAPFQETILQSIKLKLQKLDPHIVLNHQNIESITRKQIILTAPELVVTLGSKAAYNPFINTLPRLHTLISKALSTSLPHCPNNDCKTNPIFGLYLDQPVRRQLNFLKLLFPGQNSLGLLTTALTQLKASEFRAQAKLFNYDFHSEFIENPQQLNASLNNLLEDIDVFIALPDPMIHNRQTIPHVLLTTYRYNIPVLGFSRTYMQAGAVAAIYSSSEQIAQQIALLIMKIISNNPPQPGYYPNKKFEVAINRNVARSLGLHFSDEQILKASLLQLEQ